MKYPENLQPPVTEFERKTGICPLILATLMLDQLKSYLWAELPDDLADEVAQKAEIVFAGNPRWRKKFQGRRGRDYVEMFMRRWMAVALFKRKSPLFRELPEGFKNGKPLPTFSLGQKKHDEEETKKNQQKAKGRWRQKHPTAAHARPISHFVHGWELLAV